VDGRLHPFVQAAAQELERIRAETGHNIFRPHREYVAARRIYMAVLDAADLMADECSKIRHGERKLEIAK
jgi:hypothetical protein